MMNGLNIIESSRLPVTLSSFNNDPSVVMLGGCDKTASARVSASG
jgi:hypothetical protein